MWVHMARGALRCDGGRPGAALASCGLQVNASAVGGEHSDPFLGVVGKTRDQVCAAVSRPSAGRVPGRLECRPPWSLPSEVLPPPNPELLGLLLTAQDSRARPVVVYG